ncbi:MAG: LTA synthase family protein [Paludibacteraceae bacterium]|nr:LTA synthase family protein [Paludibacteraceae bacterium]
MLWQHNLMGDVTFVDFFRVIYHAFPLDLSVASYVTLVYGLLLCVSVWIRPNTTKWVSHVYTAIMLTIGLWVMLGDNGCFPSWGFRMDRTIFIYLTSPREVLACAPWWQWLSGGIAYIVLMSGWMWLYGKWVGISNLQSTKQSLQRHIGITAALLFISALLFLPIRGSVTVSTMNTGRVYFSDKQMLNLAAVNPVFNIVESLSEQSFDFNRYTFMSEEEADTALNALKAESLPLAHDSWLRTKRPNIVLIIWESMSANAWEAMPRMQEVSSKSIIMDQAYASSFRTDRGVVAVLSGFPGQPTSSLMTAPTLTKGLPYISRDLQKQGYNLQFYYGGDEDFTNMRSYLTNAGFNHRISDHSFPISDRLSKWGVPDHILTDTATTTILKRWETIKGPTLDVVLTLSSHEPFEVPATRHFEHPYLNSIAYTDSCVGVMIDRLSQSPEWDSTVVVILGDHGYPYPNGVQNQEPARYHLPLIFTGGALTRYQTIHQVCSQIDWIPTLLAEMQMPSDAYPFAKDAIGTSAGWAVYAFNDGFGLITSTGLTVFDRKMDGTLHEDSIKTRLPQLKAYMQNVYEAIRHLNE